MRPSRPGRLIVSMAGTAGTSALGYAAFRTASSHSSTTKTLLEITASILTTAFVVTLGLILNYRLSKLALKAQTDSAERDDGLRRLRLELQKATLEKIKDGTQSALAYQRMAAAEALYLHAQHVPPLSTQDRRAVIYCKPPAEICDPLHPVPSVREAPHPNN